MPFSDRGKALSRDAKIQKTAMEKSISDIKNIEMMKGVERIAENSATDVEIDDEVNF